MKKIFCFVTMIIILICQNVYAIDNNQLLDMRNEIFDESREIKPLLGNSKNVILLNNMWDACIITITQMDAYFFMMGIFDSMAKDIWNEEAVNYLEIWLNKIKGTNDVNLRSLEAFPADLEDTTQGHVKKLIGYFTDLNSIIDENLSTIAKLKASVQSNK